MNQKFKRLLSVTLCGAALVGSLMTASIRSVISVKAESPRKVKMLLC
ncbi:hypothetical protein PL321_12990 [Caloramator sp. mosi_1]|nr:hypothetical protein [Caloramator sp. mosi_1]WDC83576.1 hypothetical protein PL321_12990 [Caloramator sp. mosi_1]